MHEPEMGATVVDQLDDCPGFLASYLRYLEVFQSRSPSTIRNVYLTLREFLQYVHYKKEIRERPPTPDAHKDMSICNMMLQEITALSRLDIDEYLCFLDTVTRNTSSTIRKKLCAIRVFYQYLIAQQRELDVQIPADPTAGIPGPSAPPPKLNVLTHGEVDRLLNAVSGENSVRDYCIILLMATTAVSIQEAIALNESDYSGQELRIRGDKPRTILLTSACTKALDKYLAEFRGPLEDSIRGDAMFVSLRLKQRITPRCVQRAILKHVKAAGLEGRGYTAQNLRDTAVATILNQAGDSERAMIMDYFGFRSPQSEVRFSPGRKKPNARVTELIQNSAINNFGR